MMKILGQEAALSRLRQMFDSSRIPSALLFWGPEGVGKRMTARAFAAALNCERQVTGDGKERTQKSGTQNSELGTLPFCGECLSCERIFSRRHPDVTEADESFQAALLDEPIEKQRNFRIDTIRALTLRASRKSTGSPWKVFVLDNAQNLVPEAANALLKALEEPAEGTLWILITSRRERMLPTVASRCQSISFQPLPEQLLRQICVREGLLNEQDAARWAGFAEGSISRALRLSRYGALADEARKGPAGYWTVSQGLPRDLSQARETTEGLLDVLVAEAGAKFRDERPGPSSEIVQELLQLKQSLRSNVSPQLVLQLALLKTEVIK